MKLSLFAPLFRKVGLAIAQRGLCSIAQRTLRVIVSILLLIQLTIVYPAPTATSSLLAQTETGSSLDTTVTPLPQTPTIQQDSQNTPQIETSPENPNPRTQSTPNQEQTESGGPYDLKAIQKSYKSLYGS
ncbi:MAG: hypothetical protein ACRC1Z_05990 [Waterburya sp.]